MVRARPAAVAGSFYPERADVLASEQQVRRVLQDFRQVGDDDRGGVDDGVAVEFGRLAFAAVLKESKIIGSAACIWIASQGDTISARKIVFVCRTQIRISILPIGYHHNKSMCEVDARAPSSVAVLF